LSGFYLIATACCLLLFPGWLQGDTLGLPSAGSLPTPSISSLPPTEPVRPAWARPSAGNLSGWAVFSTLLGSVLLLGVASGSPEARVAADDERRRLRHDLHDGPVQSLLGLQMFLAHRAD
jgi:hypothetical protein